MRLIPLVASAAISACLPMGDGWFHVSGEVLEKSGAPASCELRLLSSPRHVDILQEFKVRGPFKETFMVPPVSAAYEVELFCVGKLVQSRTVKYGKGTEREINFGKMTGRRDR